MFYKILLYFATVPSILINSEGKKLKSVYPASFGFRKQPLYLFKVIPLKENKNLKKTKLLFDIFTDHIKHIVGINM